MNKDEILIVDIETTGFANADFIIEIGIVSLNVLTGVRKLIVDEVVWEKGITRPIVDNSWIVNNSSLSSDLVYQGVALHKVQKLIQHILDMYPRGMTAFNNAFDFRFLEDRGFTFNKLPCPMKLLVPITKLPYKGGKEGYKYPNVMEAYKHYFPNEEYIELHRGGDDAIHEARIVWEMIKEGSFKLD